LYGGWEASYNRLGVALVVVSLGYVTKIYNNQKARVFGRAFWPFGLCIRAFQHYRPVMAVHGTFFTGQYKDTFF
jgi:hypothetical protein